MTRIEAVLFDYGQVLSGPPDADARAMMQSLLGAETDQFAASYWRYRDAYDRGTLSGQAYWHSVARELGHEADQATIEGLLEADVLHWTQPNEAMIAWAAELQRAEIKTGILSNLGDAMEAGLHQRFPWLQEFNHMTFSHRLGIAKPDAAIYTHAAEGLGVPVQKILFIDDREENIAAARALGMVAIQYGEHGAFLQALERAGFESLLRPIPHRT
jgi:putative hydrolase of the HAD superfamily